MNINRWVLAQGWAVPAYYNSMSKSEISILQKLATKAQGKGSGIWGDYRARFGAFNFKLLHIAGKNLPDFQSGDDAGPVILPKI